MKSKEILETEDQIKYLISSSLKGLTPSYIEDSVIYGSKKLIRTALQNLILSGELVYDEDFRLHLKNSDFQGEKQMNVYNNIKEVFVALAEGKKVRKTTWNKDLYIHFHDGFICWNDNLAYCDSFDGSWCEYVDEKKYSFDELEVGKSYRIFGNEKPEFTIVYKSKTLFVGRQNGDDFVGYKPYGAQSVYVRA